MTPRQYKEYVKAEAATQEEADQRKAEAWHYSISSGGDLLCDVLDEMFDFKLHPKDVPLIIRLVENPKYRTSKIFTGAVDLFTHDCIHVLLGRGLLPKDEAFVIGYTMGSSKKMKRWRRNLFMFVSKYLYPEGYKFGEEERYVFYSGVMAGSRCDTDLSEVDFSKKLGGLEVEEVRCALGIDREILKCYYTIAEHTRVGYNLVHVHWGVALVSTRLPLRNALTLLT